MGFIIAMTLKQSQIGGRAVAALAVPVVSFGVVFWHEMQSIKHTAVAPWRRFDHL
jgi:hypothetical protein